MVLRNITRVCQTIWMIGLCLMKVYMVANTGRCCCYGARGACKSLIARATKFDVCMIGVLALLAYYVQDAQRILIA